MTDLILTTKTDLRLIIEQSIAKCLEPNLSSTGQPSESILTLDEASTLLKVPKATIYQLTYRREIPFIKIGRSLRFRTSDLNVWLSEKRKATKKEIITFKSHNNGN